LVKKKIKNSGFSQKCFGGPKPLTETVRFKRRFSDDVFLPVIMSGVWMYFTVTKKDAEVAIGSVRLKYQGIVLLN